MKQLSLRLFSHLQDLAKLLVEFQGLYFHNKHFWLFFFNIVHKLYTPHNHVHTHRHMHTYRGRYSSSIAWHNWGGTGGWRVKDKISAIMIVCEKHFLLPRSEVDCSWRGKAGRRTRTVVNLKNIRRMPLHCIKKIFWDQRRTHTIYTEQQCPSGQNRLSLESFFSERTRWCFALLCLLGSVHRCWLCSAFRDQCSGWLTSTLLTRTARTYTHL